MTSVRKEKRTALGLIVGGWTGTAYFCAPSPGSAARVAPPVVDVRLFHRNRRRLIKHGCRDVCREKSLWTGIVQSPHVSPGSELNMSIRGQWHSSLDGLGPKVMTHSVVCDMTCATVVADVHAEVDSQNNEETGTQQTSIAQLDSGEGSGRDNGDNSNNNGNNNGGSGGWNNHGDNNDEDGAGDNENDEASERIRGDWLRKSSSIMQDSAIFISSAIAAISAGGEAHARSAITSSQRWATGMLAYLLLVADWALRSSANINPKESVGGLLTWYLASLESQPLLTKAITSGVIGVVGDVIAQYVEYTIRNTRNLSDESDRRKQHQEPFKLGTRRCAAALIDGIFICGPLMHLAYDAFESLLPVATVSATAAAAGFNAIMHVIADSIFLDGIFVASTIASSGLLEGYSFRHHIIPQLREDYVSAYKASFVTSTMMAPLEYASFRYLPLSLRVLAVDVQNLVWDAVVSFWAHKSRCHESTETSVSLSRVPSVDSSDASTVEDYTKVYSLTGQGMTTRSSLIPQLS